MDVHKGFFKVVLTGAECSGKTSLATSLSAHYKVPLVPEFARSYLSLIQRPYDQKDILKIAQGQYESEQKASEKATSMIICDTSFLVLKTWSQIKYGNCHPWIEERLSADMPNLYILPLPDIPYESDPLREHPGDRMILFARYKSELENGSVPWAIVDGTKRIRIEKAIEIIDSFQFQHT